MQPGAGGWGATIALYKHISQLQLRTLVTRRDGEDFQCTYAELQTIKSNYAFKKAHKAVSDFAATLILPSIGMTYVCYMD